MPPAQSVVWFRSLLDRLRCHIFSASTEGIFTGEAVSSMASMLEEVYSPLINAQARLLQEMETSSSEPGQTSSGLVGPNGENIHSEFNGTMAKFEAHIQDTLKQLTGDVQLQVCVPCVHKVLACREADPRWLLRDSPNKPFNT